MGLEEHAQSGGREAVRQLGAPCLGFASSRDDWDDVTVRFRAILERPSTAGQGTSP
jgi:hypothetical protein